MLRSRGGAWVRRFGWLVCVWLGVVLIGCEDEPRGTVRDATPRQQAHAEAVPSRYHADIVRQPEGPPRVQTDLLDFHGNPVGVSCSTCHSVLETNRQTRSSEQLEYFHQGLVYGHGNLSCISCHNPDNYDELRLVDGTPVPFTEVMQSCGQCHGKQQREFERGVHGGMTGFWDRTQGARHRNNCIDCHDPHFPAYPEVTPVLPPDQSDWMREVQRVLEQEMHHE